MYCGLDEIAVAIDMTIEPASRLNIQGVLDGIASLDGYSGVTVEMVTASFGSIDVSAYVKTKLVSDDKTHPTWRIAQFIEQMRDQNPTIATSTSRVLIHDPHHDMRRHRST